MRVGHINIRSIKNKFWEFKQYVLDHSFDLIGISETWLTPEYNSDLYCIPGYTLTRLDRGHNRGGGVALYAKTQFKCKIIEQATNNKNGLEQMWAECAYDKRKIAVGIIYRPHRQISLVELEESFADICFRYNHILCMGDINEDLLIHNKETERFHTLLDTYHLHQLLGEPTRITATTETLLDIICINKDWTCIDAGTMDMANLSDHELIYADLHFDLQQDENNRPHRNFKNIDMAKFKVDAEKMNWGHIYHLESINDKVNYFNECVLSLIDFYAPYTDHNKKKSKAPWMTHNIKCMLKYRDNVHKKYKQSKNANDKQHYCEIKNYVNRAIKIEKKQYYEQHLKSSVKDSKQFWGNMRKWGMINNKKKEIISTENFSPNNVNTYFINVTSDINCDNTLKASYLNDRFEESGNFKLKSVSPEEVENFLWGIKSNAVGLDGVTSQMLKLCLPYCRNEICHIINYSLEIGKLPFCWKAARVIPLQKKDNSQELDNLRPISILPPASKILEKVVHQQLTEYSEKQKILLPSQSGFRKNYSTTTALLKINDDIITSTDKGMITVVILLDMSKAFDSIDHELLLSKLHYYGIRDTAGKWFNHYLINRTQNVELKDQKGTKLSDDAVILSGVPQGSILGPLLFNIFISDIVKVTDKCTPHFYADDIQLLYSFYPKDICASIEIINQELNNIFIWTTKNGLKINTQKTVAMIYGNKHTRNLPQTIPNIKMNNDTINISQQSKNLGLLMDDQLSYDKHVANLCKSAYITLKGLYQVRDYISIEARLKLCESLVLSRLNYCDAVYGPCLTVELSNRLQMVQNACIRYSLNIPYREHISPYLKQLDWLNMKTRRWIHLCCIVYSVIQSNTPLYLSQKIEKRSTAHSVETRDRDTTLSVPIHQTEHYKRSFTYQATKIYNQIPKELKNNSVASLKRKITQSIKNGSFQIVF